MRMWQKISNFVKEYSRRVTERLSARIPTPTPPPQPPQMPPPGIDVELRGDTAEAVPPAEQSPPRAARTDYHGQMRKWSLLVIGVCYGAAALALQAIQTFETLPLSFHCLCLTLHFSVSVVIVSNYLSTLYPSASLVMIHVSIFFAGTAFTVVMAMNLLTSFMLIVVAVYLISVLVIVFVKIFGPAT